jgi:DNA-binding MarR family transcriptional regulator
MGIEQDISQTKFRSIQQKATINFIYTFNWMNEKIKGMLDQYDITSQQFNILRILRGAGKPISTLQIRQRMLDKMSDTSRIVDRLIKKKLVKKVICEGDRRLVDVSISDSGLQLLERIDLRQDEMESVFKNLTGEEVIMLNNLLDKIRSAE